MLFSLVLRREKLKVLVASSDLYIFFFINLLNTGDGKKNPINFYCRPWLEGEWFTKPNKSSFMFDYSLCVMSVLGSQVFGQASRESCVLS